MNNVSLTSLNGLLEEEFQLSSFCDYLKNGEQKISNLIGALTNVVDEFDPELEVEVVNPINENKILEILNRFDGLSKDMCVTLNSGFTTIGDITNNLNTGMADYMNGVKTSLEEISIPVYDAAGNVLEDSVSINEVIDDLKSSMASSAMERAAVEASAEENVADRITKFETIASQTVDLNNYNFKQACSYYKSLLIDKIPGKEIISKVFSLSGAEDFSNEEPTVLQDYQITKYTGASPLGAVSLNCISSIASAAGKIVGATAVAIGYGLSKIGSWLFGKVRKYTTEIFSNPYDITDNGNKKATYSFEGFQYQHHYENEGGSGYWYLKGIRGHVTELNELLDTKKNTWYTLRTIGGEFGIRWSDLHFEYDSNINEYSPKFTGDFIFKPYSLAEFIPDKVGGYTIDELNEVVNTYTGDRYLNTNSTEVDLANSFINGACVAAQILNCYMATFNDTIIRNIFPSDFTHYTDSITNNDIFKISTGYWDDNGTSKYTHIPKAINVGALGSQRTGDIYWMMMGFVTLISGHYLHNQIINPTDALNSYVPFCHGTQGMTQGRFGIKTDAFNQNLATALAAVIIVIAVTAIVIVTGVVIAKKITKKLFWKRTEFVGRCDSAMWDGGSLSKKDRRKYIKYQRKLNASNMLTKGISAAEVASDITSSSPVQDLYQNIVGTLGSDQDSSATLNSIKSLII